MKYTITSRDKEAMIDFDSLKEGEVFSFFDPESVQRGNHSVFMKIKNGSNNIVNLDDGRVFNFTDKKRITISDPDEQRGNLVYKLNAKINIIV
ncbi:MAG: hypothetical protein EBR82_49405 [Caulobacteraceae bacterium]|nr:hypothetical protein [Caulobacteraceae bacterium]